VAEADGWNGATVGCVSVWPERPGSFHSRRLPVLEDSQPADGSGNGGGRVPHGPQVMGASGRVDFRDIRDVDVPDVLLREDRARRQWRAVLDGPGHLRLGGESARWAYGSTGNLAGHLG